MKKLIFIFLSYVFILPACKKAAPGDCFNSTGKITEEMRTTGNFRNIILYDNVNLHLIQDSLAEKVKVEAGKNLLKKIITRIDSAGWLEIRNNNRCNWIRNFNIPVDVYVWFPTLDSIEYHSVGNVDNVDTLRIKKFVINVKEGGGEIRLNLHTDELFTNLHSGTADIRCFGQTLVSFVYSAGFGKIDNSGLKAEQVYALTKSGNNMWIYANKILVVAIKGLGNVYYKGNPSQISVSGNGSGKLIKSDGK